MTTKSASGWTVSPLRGQGTRASARGDQQVGSARRSGRFTGERDVTATWPHPELSAAARIGSSLSLPAQRRQRLAGRVRLDLAQDGGPEVVPLGAPLEQGDD